jgi:general secretion pathway protein C
MRLALLGPLALVLAACGGSAPEAVAPATSAAHSSTSAPTPTAVASMPANGLRRSVVHEVVAEGLGAFLQHVSVDEHPVFVAGKFHGFRIAALNDPAWWNGVDLRPGDVVTAVNGFPIEHPEDALEAFKSLEVSSELRVDYERAGTPRELRFSIIDDAAPARPAPRSKN